MEIEKFLKESILQNLFNARNDEFADKLTNSSRTKQIRDKLEKQLKSLLIYVNSTDYEYVKKEMEEVLWYMQGYVEYWDSTYYKLGVVDGFNLDKEIKKELEKKLNGKING